MGPSINDFTQGGDVAKFVTVCDGGGGGGGGDER